MADRIVVLGPNENGTMECFEIPNVGDAEAMLGEGTLRVCLSKYGGPLADATVLSWDQHHILALTRSMTDNEAADAWWKGVKETLRMARPEAIPFSVTLSEISYPIQVDANYRPIPHVH